jgi:SAM-dependent methyltransferase
MRQLVSHCAFGGGRLVRHECPSCGAIFGPQKVLRLSPEQLEADYRLTYAWYEEGDTTEDELKAFQFLGPRMDGLYLNYGAGRCSRMLTLARKMGYNIIGYEPFVASEEPHVVSLAEELKMRRFDGIISNNLTEHLTDPVGTFSFMRSLLAEGGVMAHSTPCCEYSYEQSRFHVIFFTGKALDAVCRRSGLAWTPAADPNVRLFRSI